MIFCRGKKRSADTASSKLFDQNTFYPALMCDLRGCKSEVIIECPFITSRRIAKLMPVFRELKQRGVKITINTRDPQEHDDYLRTEAILAVIALQKLGVQVLYTDGHHRKLVILDSKILYEGSLNVLSQNYSCEIMRRIESEELAAQMIDFIRLNSFRR